MKKIISLFMTFVVFLSGCGQSNDMQDINEDRPKVVAVVKAMDSLHWLSVKEGLEQAAEKYNVDLNILWPEEEDDTETQKRIIQDAIAAKPDALILAPCDSAGTQEFVDKIDVNTTQLFFMDEEGEGKAEVPFVGSDNYLAGELAAEKLADILPEGAKVAVIAGSQKQQAHFKRASGFKDYIEKNTSLKMMELKEVQGTTLSGGREAMKEILEEDPEIAGVFCASAMLVMGALEENEASGREEIMLIGMDTQSDALSALEGGKILAMISQNGYEIGYVALRQTVKKLEGNDVSDNYYVENEVITKETAEEYLQKYAMEGRS